MQRAVGEGSSFTALLSQCGHDLLESSQACPAVEW